MSYSAYVLLPVEQSVSFDEIEQLLRSFFEHSDHPDNQNVQIVRHQTGIEYSRNNWRAYIALTNNSHISTKNPVIAQQVQQKHPVIADNTIYNAKLEVITSKDKTMDYFNDYALVLGQLEQIPNALLYDEYSGEIL